LVDDIERSQIFFREFLGRSGGLEELYFYKSFVSNLELWKRDPVLVCRLLISVLGTLEY
jgi:hypothetical protein